MSKAVKVWEQVIANNNRNDDLIEQFYFLCKEEAKQEVEKRIIKLLEEQPHHTANDSETIPCYCEYSYDDAIAIIKGQKDNETVVLLTEGEQK